MKKFSDFATRPNCNLEGEKVQLETLFGQSIVVLAYRVIQAKFRPERECAQIQFELDGKKCITFTTSGVIINQLRTYEAELPFETTIKKEGKYFTFS